jgi:predicted nucleic acid binding AN1-type Zn finger protein
MKCMKKYCRKRATEHCEDCGKVYCKKHDGRVEHACDDSVKGCHSIWKHANVGT